MSIKWMPVAVLGLLVQSCFGSAWAGDLLFDASCKVSCSGYEDGYDQAGARMETYGVVYVEFFAASRGEIDKNLPSQATRACKAKFSAQATYSGGDCWYVKH